MHQAALKLMKRYKLAYADALKLAEAGYGPTKIRAAQDADLKKLVGDAGLDKLRRKCKA